MLSRFFGKNAVPAKGAPAIPANEASRPQAAVDDEWSGARWEPAQAPAKPSPQGAVQSPADPVPASASGFDKTIPAPLLEARIQAADLAKQTLEQRKNDALTVVDSFHHRIANTIRTMWGYPECSVYINKLIMSGGDGMGHNRVGFHAEAVQAMLALADLHDQEFGAPDLGGGLGQGPMTPRR